MYPEFQYFLEAYCTLGLETEEVWEAIEQFKKSENPTVQKSLLVELQKVLNDGDLAIAIEMIPEHGYRQFSAEETAMFLKHIVKQLQTE
ncbi:hypothetical protein ACQKP0_01670 [Heyndrickxia sp. NPDC080065]|uniref:hypothetical protein n=1 Tax=Heyndrickxia sp. NPDC080065 TaxID=3390568 RepID=UPI003D002F65